MTSGTRLAGVALGWAAVAAVGLAGAPYDTASTTALRPAAGTAARPLPVAGSDCRPFPADNYWNADVRDLPEHPRGEAWLSHMSTDRSLHPDFGPAGGSGPDYGIPVTVVGGAHPTVRVRFDYAEESDHVRYPFGADTRIEGGRGSAGDKHAVVVDRSTCRLYETWDTRVRDGRWLAGSGATWSLLRNRLRPDGWTSADAAGLPILPGLLRYNEVAARRVDHAIRFTTDVTSRWHLWPARHDAGLVLADNGSPWYFQGERHRRWPDRLIRDLKQIPASQFVAVDTRGLMVSPDSAAVR